jgi:hypothetical protein
LQQQTLEHQVQAELFLLQLHLKQVLMVQLVELEDQADHIAIVSEALHLVNLEVMAQVEPH